MRADHEDMAWLRLVPVAALLPTLLLLGACDSEDSDDMGVAPDDDAAEVAEPEPDPDGPAAPPAKMRPEPVVPCDLEAGGGEACTTADGGMGTSFCIIVDGEELLTPCSTQSPECQPGDNWDMGCIGEICYWDGAELRSYYWEEEECNTPLVVSFDGAPIEYMPAVAASFDLSPDGTCMSSDWPTAPWLALDRDGDGFIRSGSELFGSATKMSSGGYAPHGFAALAELDSDRDGKITARDERFGELVLWSDVDDDRVGSLAELRPLHETTLVSIDLGFDRRASCDSRGNCGFERAALEYRTAQGGLALGEVVDVHLGCQ